MKPQKMYQNIPIREEVLAYINNNAPADANKSSNSKPTHNPTINLGILQTQHIPTNPQINQPTKSTTLNPVVEIPQVKTDAKKPTTTSQPKPKPPANKTTQNKAQPKLNKPTPKPTVKTTAKPKTNQPISTKIEEEEIIYDGIPKQDVNDTEQTDANVHQLDPSDYQW